MLVDRLRILLLTAASVVDLGWFWAAAAAVAAAALLQLLLWLLRAGCVEGSGCAAATAAAAAVVHSDDAAAGPAWSRQVVQRLDVSQNGSDLLTAVAQYGSEVSAAVAVL